MIDRPAPAPLAPRPRLLGQLAGLGLFLFGSPGMGNAEGWPLASVVGLGLWAALAARPYDARRWRGRLAEWFAGSVTVGATMFWTWHVWPPTVLYMGTGFGLYVLFTAALLRALVRRVPLVLALPLAWTGVEVLRSAIPTPFGIGWLRFGHFAHHHLWFSGSARVWGVEGVGFALAALAGVVAVGIAARGLRVKDLGWGLGPTVLAALLALAVGPPATRPGPRLLLVQPGFSQARKQTYNPNQNFAEVRELTHTDLARRAAAGEEPPDLVCWGESMLFLPLFDPGVEEALGRGLQLPPWEEPLDAELVERYRDLEKSWVRGGILGLRPFARADDPGLPPGTSFLTGVEYFCARGEEIRRRNAVVLYGPDGEHGPAAGKRYLVPGAETMLGLERLPFIRDGIQRIAGYIPDLVEDDETGAVALGTRDGRRFRLGATVCFDNAFLPPYVDPVGTPGGIDFHVVTSNEAWYLESAEVDQMVAFSRLIALSTGRSIVRATNSGISLGLGPDGREIGRIREGGRDRLVRGTLLLEVPVPAGGPAESVPPYVRLRLLLRVLLATLPAALLALFRGAGGYPPRSGG